MDQEVRAAIYEAENDSNVRVIILTGAGRGFCAGADMSLLGAIAKEGLESYRGQESFLRNTGNGERQDVRPDFQKKYSYFPSIRKPVIAAVNGPAVGLGFILTLYCDLRFAAERRAIWDGVCEARADCRIRTGVDAAAADWAGQCVGHAVLGAAGGCERSFADGFGESGVSAGRLYAQACMHMRRNWRIMLARDRWGLSKPRFITLCFKHWVRHLRRSEQEMVKSLQCEDFKEGVAHFVEKRPPVFTGR